MIRLAFDLEADGGIEIDWLDKITTIHSLEIQNVDTGESFSCADQPGFLTIREGLAKLSQADQLYAHNGIKYDFPALARVYPDWTYKGRAVDTLVAARLRFAHQRAIDLASRHRKDAIPKKFIGLHSLEAWGHRLGNPKAEYEGPWDVWSPAMQSYCQQDTGTLVSLIKFLESKHVFDVWATALDGELELAWYLAQQERNGWPFNMEKAAELQGKLAEARELVAVKLRTHFGSWQAKNGKPFIPKRDNKRLGYLKGVAVQKYKTVSFNPASRDHIARCLIERYGWKPNPQQMTEGGKPQVDENVLRGLNYPPIPTLLEYLLLEKRLGQLAEGKQACLKLATNKGPQGGKLTGLIHVHGSVNQGGTVTHRCSHAWPNVAQTPKVGKPWGEEFRENYYVPPGWLQMGSDESGLELRCLAHYMAKYDQGEYTRVLLEGDPHAVTQHALGLPDEPAQGRTTKGRDAAKTWFYALIYGAGDGKLGKILLPGASKRKQQRAGKHYRQLFLTNLAAMGSLVEAVQKAYTDRGFLVLPDGRRAYIRHQHAALNTLLQGAGAVISKWWVIEFSRRMTERFGPQGWNGLWVALGFIHDEIQIAVRPQIAEEACRIAVEAAEAITERFSWRCPLTGTAKLGGNWKETH